MTRLRSFSILAPVVVLLVACSSVPDEQEFCDARSTRHDKCDDDDYFDTTTYSSSGTVTPQPTKPKFDRSACTETHDCATLLFEDSVAKEALECAMSTDCDVDVGHCGDQAVAKGPHEEQADDCAKKHAECKSGGDDSGFDDDYCSLMRGLKSDLVDKLVECFDKPCKQIDDCLDSTAQAYAPHCDLD